MNVIYPISGAFNYQVREEKYWLEKDIAHHWKSLKPGSLLKSRLGQSILVLNPGVMNRNDGPDFKNAIIFYDGKFYRGSIEVHRKGRDWFLHGHEHDPAYADIILHVLGTPSPADAELKGPVVYIKPNRIKSICSLRTDNLIQSPQRVLKMLALKRWQLKMGEYMQNNVPMDRIKLLIQSYGILGAGGNEAEFKNLGKKVLGLKNYTHIKLKDLELLAKNMGWKRCGIRPYHHPRNRLSIALILNQFILESVKIDFNSRELFDLKFKEYFNSYCGLGLRSELKGNVFYPWLGAKALSSGNMDLYNDWYRAWENLKLPASYGKYRRRFAVSLSRNILTNFSCLQGLLVLDAEFCSPHHCNVCLLKNLNGYLG